MSIFKFLKHEKPKEKKPESSDGGIDKKKKENVQETPKKEIRAEAFHWDIPRMLVRPHITEKSTGMKMLNKYIVEVEPSANKISIKNAVQKLFHVTPIKIHSLSIHGKMKRFGRTSGKTKERKKVILTLKEGDKIDVGEGG